MSKKEYYDIVQEMSDYFKSAGVDVPKRVILEAVEEVLPEGTIVEDGRVG